MTEESSYAEQFYTDPSITTEKLTPEVLEEIGRLKYGIVTAIMPHWKAVTGNDDGAVVGCELEPLTPDFIRSLAKALKAS